MLVPFRHVNHKPGVGPTCTGCKVYHADVSVREIGLDLCRNCLNRTRLALKNGFKQCEAEYLERKRSHQ